MRQALTDWQSGVGLRRGLPYDMQEKSLLYLNSLLRDMKSFIVRTTQGNRAASVIVW